MNIYKVYYYSKCGTYFEAYLREVHVIAKSKEDAIRLTKEWMIKEDRTFLEKDSSKWSVSLISDSVAEGVFDCGVDSDY